MSVINHGKIYRTKAGLYHQLVSREDVQHNLENILEHIIPPGGETALELGAGTGRITFMMAAMFKKVYAFDLSSHMLKAARKNLYDLPHQNWDLAVCHHCDLPVKDAVADVVISGWSICYALGEDRQKWDGTLDKVLYGMSRALKPDGVIIIIETLGTGCSSPQPPAALIPYYKRLESRGFQHAWVRTDYQFLDMGEAAMLTNFFFGEEMLEKIIYTQGRTLLPECTGIWWKDQ